MKLKVLALLIAVGLWPSFMAEAHAATSTAGARCSELGRVLPSKAKPQLVCAGSVAYSLWVRVPGQPKSRAAALSAASSTLVRVQSLDPSAYAIDPALLSTVQTDAARMAAFRTDLSSRAATQAGRVTKYSADSAQAKGLLDSLKQKDADLNAAMDSAKKAYEPLRAELDAMYPAYSAAFQARQQYISCLILKDFGYFAGSCGSAVVDEMNRQTTLAYNAKNAQVQAALATWRTAIDAYSANLTSKNLAQQTLDIAAALSDLSTQNAGVLNSIRNGLDVDIEGNAQAAEAATQLPRLVIEHDGLVKLATAAVSRLKKSSDRNWPTLFVSAMTVEQAALAHSKQLDAARTATAYEAWVVPAPASGAWMPATFLKASQYSDVTRPEGLDFGWKWSGSSGCAGKPCTVPVVAVSRDCFGAVVTIEYRTSSGAVEATSASSPKDLRVGEVTTMEIESKFSATATAGHMAQLMCRSVGNPPGIL